MNISAEIIHTVVLVLDGTNTLSLAAAVDPLRAANRQAGRQLFEWQFVTPRVGASRLTSGLTIPPHPVRRITGCDLLLIVAGFDLKPQSTPALHASLRRLAQGPTTVAGIDGGPWIMADAGLLDGHQATTHWEDLEVFSQRFEKVETLNARYVVSGNRLTSAGAAPAIEMMLHLIGTRFGQALTDKIAGSFIYDASAPAARPQSRRGVPARHSPLTARAQSMMESSLDDPITIAQLARRLGVSPRALQLQFRDRLGCSPQAHYLALRLSEADRLVTQTTMALQDIALSTGFSSQSSFSHAYRRAFGKSARARRKALGQ